VTATKGETGSAKEAREILHVPVEVSQDVTPLHHRFPVRYFQHRDRIATMIERLQKIH